MVLLWKLLGCVLVAAAYGVGLWLRPFGVVTFLLGIPVCGWLAVLFHELGHLLAYRLLKLQWKRMAVFCFLFEPGKPPRIQQQGKLLASCTCAYDPQTPYGHYVIALLSGGAAGLLLAAVAALLCRVTSGWLQAFCLCFAIISCLDGLFNLVMPFSADRRLLKQIKQERQKAH